MIIITAILAKHDLIISVYIAHDPSLLYVQGHDQPTYLFISNDIVRTIVNFLTAEPVS